MALRRFAGSLLVRDATLRSFVFVINAAARFCALASPERNGYAMTYIRAATTTAIRPATRAALFSIEGRLQLQRYTKKRGATRRDAPAAYCAPAISEASSAAAKRSSSP